MADYISRDDVRSMILKYRADNPKKQTVWAMVISDMLRDLKEIPAADVQPVKRGRWIWDSNAPHREHGAYKCSNCGCHSDFEENYCCNCGAKNDKRRRCGMNRISLL